ncbi:MAG: histidinol-phosphate transaminase [Methylococcaceae bacterium]
MSDNSFISSLIRPEVLAMSAYKVANADGFIKLDAMENPYTWPEQLKQQWLEALKDSALNRYPDPSAEQLTQTIRSSQQIPQEFDILLGNGSDEIIQLLLMALPSSALVLSTAPAFVMYQQISRCLGLDYQAVPLLADSFELDLVAMLQAIEAFNPAIIFLAYPNNPTGNLFDAQALHQIIQATKGLVVIDEAYAPFANASFMASLHQYDNLVVMRTVSKLGLAGLRLGYLVGKPELVEQLHKIRLPYNINILTQVTADFALKHHEVFDEQTQQICEQRALLLAQLNELPTITAYPSSANFILLRTAEGQASAIFESIKAQGVLIKNMSPQGGLLKDCLRVTVGTPEENIAFIQALIKALS